MIGLGIRSSSLPPANIPFPPLRCCHVPLLELLIISSDSHPRTELSLDNRQRHGGPHGIHVSRGDPLADVAAKVAATWPLRGTHVDHSGGATWHGSNISQHWPSRTRTRDLSVTSLSATTQPTEMVHTSCIYMVLK
ncbi:hypothetical protein Tco_1422026 [Tanacetum coccineum]